MASRKQGRKGLGRGLSALMADVGLEGGVNGENDHGAADFGAAGEFIEAAIEIIRPNPDQPRRIFEESALEDLSNSIREKGIVQPLVVRRIEGDGVEFEIVAGERRWRAAQRAKLSTVPVIVRDFSDEEVLEVAIVENIQRERLSAIEEAAGYKQLIDQFGHTQERVASALGKSRSHIANQMRLLNLPEEVQQMVSSGTLSSGHARALITSPDPLAVAKRVVGSGLSVRQTEALARKVGLKSSHSKGQNAASNPQKDADTKVLENDLSANLGMSVVIDHRAGGEGRLTIQYKSLDQLDQLCQVLSSTR